MILTDRKRGEISPVITHFSATKNGQLDLFSVTGPADGTALYFDRKSRSWVQTEISDRFLATIVKI